MIGISQEDFPFTFSLRLNYFIRARLPNEISLFSREHVYAAKFLQIYILDSKVYTKVNLVRQNELCVLHAAAVSLTIHDGFSKV